MTDLSSCCAETVGEQLLVSSDGCAMRGDHECERPDKFVAPAVGRMRESTVNLRRMVAIGAGALAVVAMAGCANRWQRPTEADGRYCYVFGKKRQSICTVQPVPTAAADLEVKGFVPDPSALTVYVVRHRWGDGFVHVGVSADGGASVVTVPESTVRYRLKPGRHNLAAVWQGDSVAQIVEGQAGDVRFVQLVGAVWSWGGKFEWDATDPDDARKRALKSRLIADVEVR